MTIDGWRGQMVAMGLATPMSRALTAGTLAAGCSYAAKFPSNSYYENGSPRPWRLLNPEHPESCDFHFLSVPLTVAAFAFLFT